MFVKSSARCHDSAKLIRRRCVYPKTDVMRPQLGLLVGFSPVCHAAFRQILRVNCDSSGSGHSRGGNIVAST